MHPRFEFKMGHQILRANLTINQKCALFISSYLLPNHNIQNVPIKHEFYIFQQKMVFQNDSAKF